MRHGHKHWPLVALTAAVEPLVGPPVHPLGPVWKIVQDALRAAQGASDLRCLGDVSVVPPVALRLVREVVAPPARENPGPQVELGRPTVATRALEPKPLAAEMARSPGEPNAVAPGSPVDDETEIDPVFRYGDIERRSGWAVHGPSPRERWAVQQFLPLPFTYVDRRQVFSFRSPARSACSHGSTLPGHFVIASASYPLLGRARTPPITPCAIRRIGACAPCVEPASNAVLAIRRIDALTL